MSKNELKDRDGKPIQVGNVVMCVVMGCESQYTVAKLRPRKGEVVLRPGGWFKPANICRVATG